LSMHPPSPEYVLGPEHPPSPDYLPGFERPPSPVYVPYVLEPAYPEFMPLEDDVFPAEEQLLPAVVSPTANLLGYITEFDPEEDPEEDDEDSKEDPADYLADRDKEEEEESSEDDADDDEEEEDEDKDEEEEEHLAPADSISPPAYRTTARMSIRAQTHIPFPSEEEVDRLLAIPTPPPSPLTSYSSPLPQIPSPPLPVSSPLPVLPPPLPVSPTYPLGYRAVMIRASIVMMRAVAPSTYILAPRSVTPPSGTPSLLPIPLPTSSPPLLLPSTECRVDVLEIGESSSAPTARPTRGFRGDYGFVGTLDVEIRRNLDRGVGYGFTNTWDEMVEAMQGIAPTTLEGVNQRVTDLLNLLRRDRRSHARTARLMESEARASREAWVRWMDASDTTCSEVSALRTMILAQLTEIGDLRAADHRRHAQLIEAITLVSTLQTQMVALQSQQRPARDPAHLNLLRQM
ncbi:hypothetical protein Tco_0201095, partial [Tanacetum coccineum]